ncbi:MAG: hypothetical protein AAF335_02755 [Bacteroidota bacterium]
MKTKHYISVLFFSLSCYTPSTLADYGAPPPNQMEMQKKVNEELKKLITLKDVVHAALESFQLSREGNEYGLTRKDHFSFIFVKLLIIDKVNDPAQFSLPVDQASFEQLKELVVANLPRKLKEVPHNPYFVEKAGFIPLYLLGATWTWKIILLISGKPLPLQLSGKQVAGISFALIVFSFIEAVCTAITMQSRIATALEETIKEIVSMAQQQQQQIARQQPFNPL